MYHNRKSTERHDKIYALLGMASDNHGAAKLSVDYTAAWKEVFRALIHHLLSSQMSVDTWNDEEIAVIKGKGCVLAEVTAVEWSMRPDDRLNDRQEVTIAWRNVPSHFDKEPTYSWAFQPSAKAIYRGDAVCLLEGSSRPTIIRLHEEYSILVTIGVPLSDKLRELVTQTKVFPNDFLLVWDWDGPDHEPQTETNYESIKQI